MDKEVSLNLDIAVLGGGFAGVYCGKSLLKSFGRNPQPRIGLISNENYLVFQPMLPEVASGSISPRHVISSIRQLCKGIEIYKAEIEVIDVENKTLTLRPGPFSPPVIVGFKHLVVGVGAQVDLSRVPGMTEHSFLMQNVGDAMKLRATVLARFEEANLVTDEERRSRLLSFVVVGGGYSGVETAGQILDLFQGIHKFYGNINADEFSVALVHSRDRLLLTINESLGKYAEEKLRQRGLHIYLNRRVKALTANQVFLDDGTLLESNTVVSTVGNTTHPLVKALVKNLELETMHGRIITTDAMQVPGHDWLWAAGDCAAVPKVDGDYCPSTAQFAMRQGALLGKNLAASLSSKPLKPFRFKGLGELAAIGHMTAVAEVMGMKFSGFFAWWMWRSVYLSKLPGLDRKLRVMIDWTLDLFFPRDINLLSPRYSHLLQEAHLEVGDILFRVGDPAFSFYIVKEGSIQLADTNGEIVKIVPAGEFFGERALLSDQTWRFTATAAEETLLVGIGSGDFKAFLESSTSMKKLLERSASRYRTDQEIDNMTKTLPSSLLKKRAGDLMSTEIVTIQTSDTITETLRRFSSDPHSFYPVMNSESNDLCGVLSRAAFYDHVQVHGLDDTAHIPESVYSDLATAAPEASIDECLEIMVRAGINQLLIMGNDNQLKGILSIRDVLKAAVQ